MQNLLLHIGYHKTGTTWLQKFLFNNAAVGFSSPLTRKEIHQLLILPHALDFKLHDCREHIHLALQQAVDIGLMPVISEERLSGALLGGSNDSKEMADRLAKICPTAKILIVIREQKSMLFSVYNQYIRVGGINSLTDYMQPSPFVQAHSYPFNLDHFQYHRLIAYYISLFSKPNVLVLPYELFKAKPKDFIREIIGFCELKIEDKILDNLPYTKPVNQSLSSISLAIKRQLNRFISDKHLLNQGAIFNITGIQDRLISAFNQLDSVMSQSFKTTFDKKLKKNISEMVGERYQRSNSLTAEMLNLDLAKYGYDVKKKEY